MVASSNLLFVQCPVRRRESLHAHIVQVLESRYPDTVQREPAMLARHAAAAGQLRAAIPYWRRASELAIHRLALHEATAHLQAGLNATATLPAAPERDQVEMQLRASLGTVHMLGKGWAAPEVEQAYKRANELARAAASRLRAPASPIPLLARRRAPGGIACSAERI